MLPRISHVTYPIEFKSIGLKTTFRPFTVAEEKILLMLKDNPDKAFVRENMKTLITNCVSGPINVEQLAVYDVENFMVKIRAKSVGELVNLEYKDPDTNIKTKGIVNLDEAELVFPENRQTTIIIDQEQQIGLTLKDPLFWDLLNISEDSSKDSTFESMWGTIISSIDTIFHGDKVYKVGVDSTLKEVEEFVDQLSTNVSSELYTFFSNTPKVVATVKLENGKEVKISGVMNFLV